MHSLEFKLAHPNLCLYTENWITLEGSRRKEDGIYGCWEGKLLTSCGHYTSILCWYIRICSRFEFQIVHSNIVVISLVTQPMMQRRTNPTELRSMDSYIQIVCRFQKCKPKVSPPSPLKKGVFFKTYLGGPKEKIFKIHLF